MIENDPLFPYFFAVALMIKSREVGGSSNPGYAEMR